MKTIKLNTIYNEDCLETMSRMEDNSVDVVFTSPPYNRKRNDVYTHYNDIIDDYYTFLTTFTDECLRIARSVVVNIQPNYYNKQDVYRYIGNYSKQINNIHMWTKSNPMPASGHNITNAVEYFIMLGEPIKSNKTYTKNHIHTSVNPDSSKEHGAIMHMDVANHFIEYFTKPNDVVYDPFMGTGTTAKSCRDLGRNYIGSEISREYCDVAEQRLGMI